MKLLSENKISNKKVLLRCDFNVPVQNGIITDDSKIIKTLDTIKHLLANDNKVILLSHFGRIKKEEDKLNNSLKVVYEELAKHIELEFISNPTDLTIINTSQSKCFLVENTRFTDIPEKKESSNDLELAEYWASFADVFVVDAFASMHRAHSSTAGISKYLPTYLGFLVEKELKSLDIVVTDVKKPFVVIMGGAKVDDKIEIIESMLKKCDKLFLTGGILNTFLKVAGKNIGKSLVSENEEILVSVKNLLNDYKDKIYFTNKFVIDRNGITLNAFLEDIQEDDIIYDNIPNIYNITKDAQTIFFNGTCGKHEEKNYAFGTTKLFNELKACNANVVIGGGDTAAAAKNLGYENSFYYISSGGGASLEYIAYGNLKALEWIKENGVEN